MTQLDPDPIKELVQNCVFNTFVEMRRTLMPECIGAWIVLGKIKLLAHAR